MIIISLLLLGMVCWFTFKGVQLQGKKDRYWNERDKDKDDEL